MRYLGGKHVAWCSEYYDPASTPSTAIPPSSSPHSLFQLLQAEYQREEKHSDSVRRYRRTFKLLAAEWLSSGKINQFQHDEIVAVTKTGSWLIWRPVLYVIPRAPIEAAGRLHTVPFKDRAGYGDEYKIWDLDRREFDLIECVLK
jgi:hypothetical protein